MRRTKEEADVTRQSLLKAALVVFSRQGYADTRLEDIAAEAGVTRGAIYHHFGGKAELYTTLITESAAQVAAVINDVIAQGGSPLTLLRRLFIRVVAYAAENDDFRAINELVIFKTAVMPELETGMQKKVESTRQMVNFVAQHIQAGIEAGEIRANINPHDAAVAFIATQNGLITLWLLDRELFSLRDRAEALADLFIRGIVA